LAKRYLDSLVTAPTLLRRGAKVLGEKHAALAAAEDVGNQRKPKCLM
jgi:hypothetical protein